jgi:hypothetical protein
VLKLFSGRTRYALAFLVVGASLAVMGAQCQPTKPPLEGLRIAPAEHDFGVDPSGGGAGDSATFVVTNDGPDATGALEVSKNLFDPDDFDITSDGCNGNTLDADEDCTIDVQFDPQSGAGAKQASLVVDDPDNGGVAARLHGTAT